MTKNNHSNVPNISEPRGCLAYQIGVEGSIGEKLYGIYADGKYSDLMITCQGKTFAVHKNVVASQSKVLVAMIDSGFNEGITAHISLPDDNPTIIEHLVRFLYRGEYDPGMMAREADCRPELPYKVHAELYAIADKYDVPTLLNKSAILYECIYVLEIEKDIPQKYIEFLSSIPAVYSVPAMNNRQDLRGVASSIMSHKAFDIERATASSTELGALRDKIIKETPDFGSDLALLLMRKPSLICQACADADPRPLKRRKCDNNIGMVRCPICVRDYAYGRINDAKKILEIAKDD